MPAGAMDKTAIADAISKAEPWSSHTFEDLEAREPTDDVAVLTYRGIGGDCEVQESLVVGGALGF